VLRINFESILETGGVNQLLGLTKGFKRIRIDVQGDLYTTLLAAG
jgi:hypothetical protein